MGRYFYRTPGEAFDGDPVTPPCEDCGRDEYSCDCEPEEGEADD